LFVQPMAFRHCLLQHCLPAVLSSLPLSGQICATASNRIPTSSRKNQCKPISEIAPGRVGEWDRREKRGGREEPTLARAGKTEPETSVVLKSLTVSRANFSRKKLSGVQG
jgi:hypothetical protein